MIQTELEEAGFDPGSLKNLFFSTMHSSASKIIVENTSKYIWYRR